MDPNWAVENLKVIRTLMERSAIYRRALAPVMLFLGAAGAVAGIAGYYLRLDSTKVFASYWLLLSLASLTGAFFMVRRQALKDDEPFWSPPTRRMFQALLPALVAGFAAGLCAMILPGQHPSLVWWLPALWMAFYGCALNAAGFFMRRGIKLFGWFFLAAGAVLAARLAVWETMPPPAAAHGVMAACFGGLHLAYGFYLYFTETRE